MAQKYPDRASVETRLAELRIRAAERGRTVSVLAMARQFGMANTTFRRLYPEVVQDIQAHHHSDPASAEPDNTAQEKILKLREKNRDLKENLEFAIAAIQRLTLENADLRSTLESAAGIRQIRSS